MQQLADRGLPEMPGLDSLRWRDGRASYVSDTAEDQPPSSGAWSGSSRTNCTQYSRDFAGWAIALGGTARYIIVLLSLLRCHEH